MSADLHHHDSVRVATTPEALYALVSDVTRTGEWSPICTGCEWDDGATGAVGDWFTGHNKTAEREWTTRSQVTAAEPGREFAWDVGEAWATWRYTLAPVDGGTELAEWWDFNDAGVAMFAERYGERAETEVEIRIAAARSGIPITLAAIKRIAETPG